MKNIPEVADPIRFLRAREVVHFQRFGEALRSVQEQLDEKIYALAGGEGSSLGTGGMVTKLRAAKIATEAGCEMVIANGSRPEVLYDIMDGKAVGTRFLTQEETK